MSMTLKDLVAEHPVDRALVEEHKKRMLNDVQACALQQSGESED